MFFLCFGALLLINGLVLNMFLAAHTRFSVDMAFTGIRIIQPDNIMTSLEPREEFELYGKVIFVLVILLFWTTTYFKLKEKEA